MADYTAKRIDDMEAGFGGGFVKARAELGVTAFGLQVIQLPPDCDDYPEHDHAETARRRSTSRSRAPAGWTSKASAWTSTARRSCASAPAPSARSTPGPEGLRDARRSAACPGEAYSINPITELDAPPAEPQRAKRGARRPGAARPRRSGARTRARPRAARARRASACSAAGSRPAPWARRRG